MWRFMICCFAFLGWGFYELSGGSDFAPETQRAAIFAPVIETPEPVVAVVTPIVQEDDAQIVLASLTTRAAPLATLNAAPLIEAAKAEVVAKAEPVLEPVVVAEPVAAITPVLDIRTVKPARVNVRGGPGTNYDIVAKLVQGEETTILSDNNDGWLEVETIDGQIGWMADFLLVASN